MKPTTCRITSVSTVDLVVLKHKRLNERVVLILCCKTSVGYDFTHEQRLKVFSRWWGIKFGTKPGSGRDQEPEASLESWSPLTQPWESMRMPHATI